MRPTQAVLCRRAAFQVVAIRLVVGQAVAGEAVTDLFSSCDRIVPTIFLFTNNYRTRDGSRKQGVEKPVVTTGARIIELQPGDLAYRTLIAHLVLGSDLLYDAVDGLDERLYRWANGLGQWAIAVCNGKVAGVAAIVSVDTDRTCLFWIEVLPHFRGQGIGAMLVDWARSHTSRSLTIASVETAVPFYQRCLPAYQQDGPIFTVPAL